MTLRKPPHSSNNSPVTRCSSSVVSDCTTAPISMAPFVNLAFLTLLPAVSSFGYLPEVVGACDDFDTSGFLLASEGVSCSEACAAVGTECEADYTYSADEMNCVFKSFEVTCRNLDDYSESEFTPAVLTGDPWWSDDEEYPYPEEAHCWTHNYGNNCDSDGRDDVRRVCYCAEKGDSEGGDNAWPECVSDCSTCLEDGDVECMDDCSAEDSASACAMCIENGFDMSDYCAESVAPTQFPTYAPSEDTRR